MGRFPDGGKEFDNSRTRNKPLTFIIGIGSVIKGWDESVIDMSLGESAKIHCSPDYAYGAGGFPAWGE